MASAAALNGVCDNGLAWQKKLAIKQFIPNNIPDTDIIPHECLKRIVTVLNKLKDNLPEDFGLLAEDWEGNEGISKQDLIDFLNELYDLADYHRILIV